MKKKEQSGRGTRPACPPQNVKPAPVVPEVVQPSALSVREVALEAPASSTPAECISFDLGMSKSHATASICYLARAGWRLALERQGMAHGAWIDFCQNHVGISDDTARRYIKFFQETVGKFRTNHGLPAMVTELTDKMIAAATADIESKTATGAMIELGVMRRPPNHGGFRQGAGRKPKDVAAALKAVTEHEAVLWASAKGALDNLVKLDAERDVFRRLSDDHLAQVSGILTDLSKKAAEALTGRLMKEADL
ncbi:MAG: hypothetical protein IIZ06_02095 [Kiritimatiellae bacterium]|nr:hypothetical protein [Kiritimatiellia bacterium]